MNALYQRKILKIASVVCVVLTAFLLTTDAKVYAACEAHACASACIAGGYTGGQCVPNDQGNFSCQCTGTPPGPIIGKGFDVSGLIKIVYNITLPLAIIIGFILIVVGGYMFMTSQGDPKKTMEAKEQLTSAIMGMLFVLLSIGILRILIGSLITGSDPGF